MPLKMPLPESFLITAALHNNVLTNIFQSTAFQGYMKPSIFLLWKHTVTHSKLWQRLTLFLWTEGLPGHLQPTIL